MGAALDATELFRQFNLDDQYGFVTNPNRSLYRLPPQYSQWEYLATDIQAISISGRLRKIVDEMPVLSIDGLLMNNNKDEERVLVERAYMILCFVAHFYVRGRSTDVTLDRLPRSVAEPWLQVSEYLGIRPIITYSSTVLFNYRLLDPTQPLTLQNVWTIMTATGSIDESWFFLLSLIIETKSGPLLRIFIDIHNASLENDFEGMEKLLVTLGQHIGEMRDILARMYEENLPAFFYHRIRRYVSGWFNDDKLPNGLYYGDEEMPRQLAGGSAAQSPIIQALDIVLGIRHARKPDHQDTGVSSAGTYITDMRAYMTKDQRNVLQWLENNINIHEMVKEPIVPSSVVEAFNHCLAQLRSLRDTHIAIVSTYVISQAAKENKETKVKGTGGSNPIPFLKEVRSHMDHVYVNPKTRSDTELDKLSQQ